MNQPVVSAPSKIEQVPGERRETCMQKMHYPCAFNWTARRTEATVPKGGRMKLNPGAALAEMRNRARCKETPVEIVMTSSLPAQYYYIILFDRSTLLLESAVVQAPSICHRSQLIRLSAHYQATTPTMSVPGKSPQVTYQAPRAISDPYSQQRPIAPT